MKNYILVLVCCILTGCVSAGRFSLLDIDLRSPDQINASIPEAKIVYNTPESPQDADVKAITPTTFIVDLFRIMKCRFRFLSIEWKK